MNTGFDIGIPAAGVFAVLFGLFTTVFWMVVGWRAMRAHERIAESLSGDAARTRRSGGGGGADVSAQRERKREEASFREFMQADPVAKHLDPTEQLRRFAEWKHRKSQDAAE